jgi:hypothetical protein
MSVHICVFVSSQGEKKGCSLFYLTTLGFSVRNRGKDPRVIVHPGICPPFGVWEYDGILSTWRVL